MLHGKKLRKFTILSSQTERKYTNASMARLIKPKLKRESEKTYSLGSQPSKNLKILAELSTSGN